MTNTQINKLAIQNLANARARRTRARRGADFSLQAKIDLDRDVNAALRFKRLVFKYQFELEDAGVSTLDQMASFLREQGEL